MFDIGFGEMVLLAAIALIAIGPKQLPEVARTVGKLLGELKKAVGDVTSTVANAREETDKAIRSVTNQLTDVTDGINSTIYPNSDAAVSPNSVPAPAIDPQANATPLPDHPGDPIWVVNPAIPNPNEVLAHPPSHEQLPLAVVAPLSSAAVASTKLGDGDKS